MRDQQRRNVLLFVVIVRRYLCCLPRVQKECFKERWCHVYSRPSFSFRDYLGHHVQTHESYMYRFLRCPNAGSDAVTGLLKLRLGLAFGSHCLFGLL